MNRELYTAKNDVAAVMNAPLFRERYVQTTKKWKGENADETSNNDGKAMKFRVLNARKRAKGASDEDESEIINENFHEFRNFRAFSDFFLQFWG